MKRILVICFIHILFFTFLFSQENDHSGGGNFLKRIEYNKRIWEHNYNFDSKGDVEKLFYGDFNAPVEFFFSPSSVYVPEVPCGFRIVKDTLNKTFTLEIKYISNFREALKEAYSMYPLIASTSIIPVTDDRDPIRIQNRENIKKASEAVLKLYTVDSRSFSVSYPFAEKLYNKMVSLIANFKARGIPPGIEDGYSVTFRTVVDDEVWSLRIHMPTGTALKMSDICRQMIKDAKNNQMDEAIYIKLLDDF